MPRPPPILLRVPNWLGDCVMCLPALDALAAAHPQQQIHVACRAQLRDCFSAHPRVSEIIAVPASGGLGAAWQLWQNGGSLRPRAYGLGLLFTNSLSTALWLWRTGAAHRLGYATDGRGLLLTRAMPVTAGIAAAHMADYYLNLAACAGADPGPGVPRQPAADEPVLPSLRVPDAGRDEAARLLERLGVSGAYGLLAPASAYGQVKDWPAARYAETIRRLRAAGDPAVLVTGTPAQARTCAEIAAAAGGGAHSVAGSTTLGGFLGLAAGCSWFLGGDSGGAHVAAACGKPTVVIFGITEPARTRQLGERVRLVGSGGTRTPDLDDPSVCRAAEAALSRIAVEEVLGALAEARK